MAGVVDQGRIEQKGREIFGLMKETPAVFDKRRWTGELMNLAMRDPGLKVQLFRFIDVFPTLTTTELLSRHLREYFLAGEAHLPLAMRMLFTGAAVPPVAGVAAPLVRKNVLAFSRLFLAGSSPEDALESLKDIRDHGRTFSLDILGEAALSEKEALAYQEQYLALIDFLAKATGGWPSVQPGRDAVFPRHNVSVKISSLYSRLGPLNHEDSVEQVKTRLRPIFRKARATGGGVTVDAETYDLKSITHEVFTGLLEEKEFQGWEGAGLAVQAYLKETPDDLQRLIGWARAKGRRIALRLVKGAYWEYETVTAARKEWSVPVFALKTHTDWNFERCAELLLANTDCVAPALGTHNVRSLAFVLATAEHYGVPGESLEIQMLYGMAEPIKAALLGMGHVVREYTPVGDLLPGMAYLVRRLLENTSNEGFLRQTFVEMADREALLAAPEPGPGDSPTAPRPAGDRFRNEPLLDFSQKANREACRAALEQVRGKLGRSYPAVIRGKECRTDETTVSRNPDRQEQVIGTIAEITPELADRAVAAAREGQPFWGRKTAAERAGILFRAAELARRRRSELLAWQVLETGKNWAEADADVTEAIDYLDYYGREMVRLARPVRLDIPGEDNRYHYQALGVGLVIAPWNFPLAISMGMVSAALVTGNAVLYKPSPLSPVNGWQVFSLLREAGIPEQVLQFVPGRGETAGSYLAGHRDVDFIAFTGSRNVGLKIIEQAGRTVPGQRRIKRAIVEMGGKNAIIVDDDADLDQAVAGVMQSAFGYQGQKCSSCSRAIVLAGCYDRFLERLAEAVKGIAIGSPLDPKNFMGPVIDPAARDRILAYLERGRREGKIVATAPAPEGGLYVSPTVIADLPADSVLLRDEIFGPILAVIKVRDMEEALTKANETDYALTGGLYSRSPAYISRALEEFQAGNFYINRPITGAVVGRQPFGGFKMSGVGSKAGGPDYLLQFLEPRVTTENTLRRGFAPEGIA